MFTEKKSAFSKSSSAGVSGTSLLGCALCSFSCGVEWYCRLISGLGAAAALVVLGVRAFGAVTT